MLSIHGGVYINALLGISHSPHSAESSFQGVSKGEHIQKTPETVATAAFGGLKDGKLVTVPGMNPNLLDDDQILAQQIRLTGTLPDGNSILGEDAVNDKSNDNGGSTESKESAPNGTPPVLRQG